MRATLFFLAMLALVGFSLAGGMRKGTAVAAISQGIDHHIFARGYDNLMYYNKYTGSTSSWVGWTKLTSDTTFIGTPTAVSWVAGRLDVFAIDVTNKLLHNTFSNGAWGGWVVRAVGFLPQVRAVTATFQHISVFIQDLNQKSYVLTMTANVWGSVQALGNITPDTVVVPVSWGSNRLDVFCIFRNQLYHRASNNAGQAWSEWAAITGTTPSYYGTPAVTSGRSDRLDIFFIENYAGVRQYTWDNAWTNQNLGGPVSSDVSAVSWGDTRIDMFALGDNGYLYWKHWNGNQWSAYSEIFNIMLSAPTASTAGTTGSLAVFGLTSVGTLYWGHYDADAGKWSNFEPVGTQVFVA